MATQSKDTHGFFIRLVHTLDSIQFGGSKEREYLVENLSMLIASGMTILSALDALEKEARSRSMKRMLESIRSDIQNGSPVWKAFAHSKLFREHTVSLVRIGEETGKLSDNLKLIALQEAKERDFRSKIRSAMMYPIFVLSLTMIIGILIAWFILPRLSAVFAQLQVELPSVTKVLIASGEFLGTYGHIAFPSFIVFTVLSIFFLFYFSKTKFIGQAILFSLPGIKNLIRDIELARFGYLLGSLLEAGVPVIQAIDSLEKATIFPNYKKFYGYLRTNIEQGNSFQQSFDSYSKTRKLMPIPIQQLIIAGERSGNLSNALQTVSINFEAKTEQTTRNIAVILEPILLVIVWLGVVAVALAVILPIYSLVGGLNTNPAAQIEESASPIVTPVEVVVDDPVYLEIVGDDITYLNVRGDASIEGETIGRVFPGDIYEYTGEDESWYEIVLPDESVGWISGDYVIILSDNKSTP